MIELPHQFLTALFAALIIFDDVHRSGKRGHFQ
jgi:hypothetical protein